MDLRNMIKIWNVVEHFGWKILSRDSLDFSSCKRIDRDLRISFQIIKNYSHLAKLNSEKWIDLYQGFFDKAQEIGLI